MAQQPVIADDGWAAHSSKREKATFAITNLLICVLVPLWCAFDFYLEPALAPVFLVLRLADVAITVGLWAVIARSENPRTNRIAMMTSVVVVGVVIALMLPRVADNYLLYVFGFSLVFWGCGLLLTWPPAYLVSAYAIIVAVHLVLYMTSRAHVPLPVFVGALFYLASAAVISVAQLAVRRRLEYQAFRANTAIEQNNAELARTVDVLRATQARLAASSALLATSLDPDATAQQVTSFVVPSMATWAVLLGTGPHGTATCAASHVTAERGVELVAALGHNRADGAAWPVSRNTELIVDDTHDALVRVLGSKAAAIVSARSLIVTPLVARDQLTGTLVLGQMERAYDATEVAFAEDLAHRAALALDNARMYRESEHSVRLRDDFISIASHELRTPLGALSLIVEGMLASSAEPKRDTLTRVDRQLVRLSNLVSQLLDVSQLTAGRLVLEPHDVDLVQLISDVVDEFKELATRMGSPIRLAVPPALHGQWDRARLEQVISNLLANAIKYGRGQPVDIALERANDHVVVLVSDHGLGIADADRARIFERFERAVSARYSGGFGIGLWLARMIVEGMGGTIHVESALDRGSTFSVELPIMPPTASVPQRLPTMS